VMVLIGQLPLDRLDHDESAMLPCRKDAEWLSERWDDTPKGG